MRWYVGSTETGPSPYQFVVPSEITTGENAICPTTRPSTSATSDKVKTFAERRASMMNCSVWLLISRISKAATVTSLMTESSYFVSSLINIFCVVIVISFHRVVWRIINHLTRLEKGCDRHPDRSTCFIRAHLSPY